MKRWPPQCASAIQIVRSLESTAETQPNSNRLTANQRDGGAVSNFLNHSVDLRAFAKPQLATRLPVLEGSDASNKRRYKAGAE
jgi:hypothetical protein